MRKLLVVVTLFTVVIQQPTVVYARIQILSIELWNKALAKKQVHVALRQNWDDTFSIDLMLAFWFNGNRESAGL